MKSLRPVDDEIWCDVHQCIHEQNDDPYQYGFAIYGGTPECSPYDWHKLWVGGVVARRKEQNQGI